MSEATVKEKYNNITLIMSINGASMPVGMSNVLDYQGDRLEIEDIQIGDIATIMNDYYYMQKPKLYQLDIIECHPYYENFYKPSLLDFTHFRKVQIGDRCKDLAIGISIIELAIIKKNEFIPAKLKSIGDSDSTCFKIGSFLEKKLKNGDSIDSVLNEIGSKLLMIENFGMELRVNYGEDEAFSVLDICFCRYNSRLQYVGGNEKVSYYRISFMCNGDKEYAILYTKDMFMKFRNENIKFLHLIDPKPSKDFLAEKLSGECESIEKLLISNLNRSINMGEFFKLNEIISPYFISFNPKSKKDYLNIIHQYQCYSCQDITLNDKVKLDCGHKYCNQCFTKRILELTTNRVVLLEEEKQELTTKISCTCGVNITDDIIKNNIKNYSTYEKAAKDRVRIKCENCEYKCKVEMFLTECKHYCTDCVISLIRLGYQTCYKCNNNLSANEVKLISKIKAKCFKCQGTYSSIQAFPYKLCEHEYCYKCAKLHLDSEGNWKCLAGCIGKIENNNITYYYYRAACIKCNEIFNKTEDYYMHKTCLCQYCIKCISSFPDQKCEKCTTPNSSYMIYLIDEYKTNLLKRLKECPVCQEKKDLDSMVLFQNCSHMICIDCMKGCVVAAYADSNYINLFKCPIECQAPIAEEQLEEFLSIHKMNLLESTPENNKWDKANMFKIRHDIKLSKCPKCPCEFITGDERRAWCPACDYQFCTKCGEDFHPPDKSCQLEFIKRRIQDLEQSFPGEPISQCPICKSPYMKDDKCNHVKCKDCNLEFCFVCAAKRSPILAHGNHYHRPQCTDYFDPGKGEVDKIHDKCDECKSLGALCPRPVNLEVRGRYKEDEIGY